MNKLNKNSHKTLVLPDVEEQILTIDGKIPSVGDVFHYESKTTKGITSGIVGTHDKISIASKNGVYYRNSEIFLKKRDEKRDEILNEILKK